MCIFILLRRLCVDLGASRRPNIITAILRLATANLLIVVLLSLKNSPFFILMTSSYERLNTLHRVVGYTTLISIVVHSCTYTVVFARQNFLQRLLVREEIFGMIAMVSFIALSFAGCVLRTWWYELFYYLHVTFWILAIIMTGLHQPEPGKKILYVVCVSAGIWGVERILRLTRIIFNSINNTVILTPLPNGGTRVILTKAPRGSFSGKHGYLWTPAVRALETHPFTMVSTDPLEFVVAAYDGFTRALHKYALENPGIELKASVEGPYGSLPDFRSYGRVMLIAGGSGASFTIGAALNMLKTLDVGAKIDIEFIWMIRNHTYLAWFSEHLETLHHDRRVSTKVYVTRTSDNNGAPQRQPSSSLSTTSSTSIEPDPEKDIFSGHNITTSPLDITKHKTTPTISPAEDPLLDGTTVYLGRPDVPSLIKELIESTPSHKRVLVMGCGPKTLMSTVRNATSDCVMDNRATIELHLEQFGW
ncbi:ferric-chelate reductase [Fusarium heterosporum]|uniref:Ferric-chelate reductase n=1 Tax=Fusarium heterosporum TaxID=42747 RepID=A0A8H5T6E5_FUSHE|nr:ferric-chelate reductase [Fusarium heterosporum]